MEIGLVSCTKSKGDQIHEDRSRIDFQPAEFDDEDLTLIERETNEVIESDRSVTKEEHPRAEVEANVPRAGHISI